MLYNPSVTASRATSLYTREAFCFPTSAYLLTIAFDCGQKETAESNQKVTLGGVFVISK